MTKKNQGEKIVRAGRPALKAFWLFYAAGALAVVFTGVVAVGLPAPSWIWGPVLLFCSIMFVFPLFLQRAYRYTVTPGAVRSEFCLWVRREYEAPTGYVTDVSVRQGFVDRLLGIGEISFNTPGTMFSGVTFGGVRDPLKTKCELANKIFEGKA